MLFLSQPCFSLQLNQVIGLHVHLLAIPVVDARSLYFYTTRVSAEFLDRFDTPSRFPPSSPFVVIRPIKRKRKGDSSNSRRSGKLENILSDGKLQHEIQRSKTRFFLTLLANASMFAPMYPGHLRNLTATWNSKLLVKGNPSIRFNVVS